MREELITFETAKLAKEKGFDIEVLNHYASFETLGDGTIGNLFQDYMCNSELERLECSAPTQSLLQKWLREKHNIHISIRRLHIKGQGVEYNDFIYLEGSNEDQEVTIGNEFDTHEEALENAIFQSLKLIKP